MTPYSAHVFVLSFLFLSVLLFVVFHFSWCVSRCVPVVVVGRCRRRSAPHQANRVVKKESTVGGHRKGQGKATTHKPNKKESTSTTRTGTRHREEVSQTHTHAHACSVNSCGIRVGVGDKRAPDSRQPVRMTNIRHTHNHWPTPTLVLTRLILSSLLLVVSCSLVCFLPHFSSDSR